MIKFAHERHAGQVDKAGQDYIQHPLRVMQNVQHAQGKICAVLHDILEDTPTTIDELKDLGFDQNVIDTIIAVTKVNGENRFQAVQRTIKNPIACEVKLADLSDNMDLSRLPEITAKDVKRYKQYQKVQVVLKEAYAIHQHVDALGLNVEYTKFEYGNRRFNFQYLMNALFDQLHPLGGNQIDSPQEWWILFEDASEYFAYCKRKKLKPFLKHFIQLFNSTDRDFFGSLFQTPEDQDILMEIYNNVLGHHFKKDIV